MKELLSADLFNLRRGKAMYLLFAGAVLAGILMPLMYYGLIEFVKLLEQADPSQFGDMMVPLTSILEYMDSDLVFKSVLPLNEGYGLIICGVVCFYNCRQFANGIIRNKIIAGKKRSAVYLSMLITSQILALSAALIYSAVCAVATVALFGALKMSAGEIVSLFVVSVLMYAVYAAITVMIVFLLKSVPLSLVVSIVFPIIVGTIFQLVASVAQALPEKILPVCAVFPTFAQTLLVGDIKSSGIVPVFTVAVVAWVVLFTVIGILRFRRSDIR